MANRQMYFGTSERMVWVPCPSINVGMNQERWGETSTYLNGGSSSRFSTASHVELSLAWNPTTHQNLYSVLDYFNGSYGEPPYYMLSPFAINTNVLPSWLASPRVASVDGPSLLVDKRPTLLSTPDNPWGYPTKTAVYAVNAGDTSSVFKFPVPPGYTFHMGAKGSSSGTAALSLNGFPVALGYTSSPTDMTSSTTDSWAQVSVTGAGALSLTAIYAVVLPTGEAPVAGPFVSGRGNSGLALKASPVVTGYSAALNSVGATVDLTEVGAWA